MPMKEIYKHIEQDISNDKIKRKGKEKNSKIDVLCYFIAQNHHILPRVVL